MVFSAGEENCLPETTMKDLGKYVAELRKKRRLTLRRVEELTGIPNAYLSQLETGRKTYLPPARLMFKLAECLGVTTEELLTKAGYLNQTPVKESLEKKVERAFRHVVTDPRFRYGENVDRDYDFAVKRFVVELYERATRRRLIDESDADYQTSQPASQPAMQVTSSLPEVTTGDQERKTFIRNVRKREL
jgi:HTH-type transcriptional regulator, competence development regulator